MPRPPSASTPAAPPRRPRPSSSRRFARACVCSTSAAGPGSITRGLAQRLAPGEVVGLDLSRETLATARADAAARGLTNLPYTEASVYELPFPDQLLRCRLRPPGHPTSARARRGPREMLRVLRPGGLVGIRDVDWGTVSYWPLDPRIDRFIEVHFKTWYRNGGEPRIGRQLKALFNAAPVTDVDVTAAVWCYATPEETTEWGESYAQRLLTSPMGGRMVEYGFASGGDLEAMAAASAPGPPIPTRSGRSPRWRPWRERRDARPDLRPTTDSRGSRPARG